MKRLLLLAVCCLTVLLVSLPACAQAGIAGTYQGTIPVGKGLRIVVKISKGTDGTLTSEVRSIDQGGQPLPVKSTTLTGNTLTIDQPALGATYEGKVAPDFATVTGTFTQGGTSFPVILTRAISATTWTIPEAPKPVTPMAKDAKPAFEVATVKPSKPDTPGKMITVTPSGSFRAANTTLGDLISFAYEVQMKQVVGAPDWADTDKFDISARPDTEGTPNDPQLKSMIQGLLADRFGLKFHRGERELAAYLLTAPKGADKVKVDTDGGDLPGLFFSVGNGITLNVRNARMADFTQLLQSNVLDRPVIDRTGLPGRYDFQLQFTPDDSMMGGMGSKLPPTPEGKEPPPGLFAAIPAQLGFKLEPAKTSVPVLIVDHLTRPTDN